MILYFSHSFSPMFHYYLSTMKMEMAKLDRTNAQIQRGGRAKRPNHRTTKVEEVGLFVVANCKTPTSNACAIEAKITITTRY